MCINNNRAHPSPHPPSRGTDSNNLRVTDASAQKTMGVASSDGVIPKDGELSFRLPAASILRRQLALTEGYLEKCALLRLAMMSLHFSSL